MKTKSLLAVFLALAFPMVEAQERRPLATTGEVRCLGFIHDTEIPLELFVSGTEEEGRKAVASVGNLIYISGPGLQSTKVGESLQVVRPQGKVKDPHSKRRLGVYYREGGTVQVEALSGDTATARVVMGCDVIYKGDLLVRMSDKHIVRTPAALSTALTPYPASGLVTSIVLAKDDKTTIAAGDICYIGVGKGNGIQAGDRFTVYRVQPRFDAKDMIVNQTHSSTNYGKMGARNQREIINALEDRRLPRRVIGDLVVLNVSCTTSAAMVVNSRSEIYLGDTVVRQ